MDKQLRTMHIIKDSELRVNWNGCTTIYNVPDHLRCVSSRQNRDEEEKEEEEEEEETNMLVPINSFMTSFQSKIKVVKTVPIIN